MDRYQRVEKPRPDSAIKENEIRITAQGLIRNYISYATSLLQEKEVREIVLKAMGQAISKTVVITEIIKKRIPKLHQDTTISSISITDVWEPIEEGLVPLEMTRHVSLISITLSTKELNKNSPGYQAPSYVEQPNHYNHYEQQHQPRQVPGPIYEDTYGRGRGHVRGRGRGRGWGRGGYRGGYGGYDGGYEGYDGGYRGYDGGYGRYDGGYSGYDGRYNSGYGNNQENGVRNQNYGRSGGRGTDGGYRGGDGYERGRGGGGGGWRGYGRGRGRIGGRGRGNQAY